MKETPYGKPPKIDTSEPPPEKKTPDYAEPAPKASDFFERDVKPWNKEELELLPYELEARSEPLYVLPEQREHIPFEAIKRDTEYHPGIEQKEELPAETEQEQEFDFNEFMDMLESDRRSYLETDAMDAEPVVEKTETVELMPAISSESTLSDVEFKPVQAEPINYLMDLIDLDEWSSEWRTDTTESTEKLEAGYVKDLYDIDTGPEKKPKIDNEPKEGLESGSEAGGW